MSLRIVSTPLTGSLVTRAASQNPGNDGWFVNRPATADEWRNRAAGVRSSLVHSDWVAALAPAMISTGLAASRLESASSAGFAVTTGQQPGLFGGPLYTWWKALSALALADRLQALTGQPVVPIFWAATDDSDFLEASATTIVAHDKVVPVKVKVFGDGFKALSTIPLGDVTEQMEQLASVTGSAPNAGIMETVRRVYGPGNTIGSAYVGLLREILNPLGIVVLDASHDAVRTAAFPVLKDALLNAAAIDSAIDARTRNLVAAGYFAQVKPVKGRTLVFSESDGRRERVALRDGSVVAATAKSTQLGPNVLLRPVIERSILPTVAYVGGPAEVAYFAQVSAVAEALGVMAPLVVPRWSGLVIEPRIYRILQKRGLTLDELRDPHAAESRIARESLPPALTAAMTNVRDTIQLSTAALQQADSNAIVTPAVLSGLAANLTRHLDRLERRYRAAIKKGGNDALTDVAAARASLFPGGVPQERALNVVPLLARHGNELIAAVMREIEAHAAAIA